MLGIAPAVAALLLAGQFEPTATATLETRAGEAPFLAGEAPEAAAAAVLTPELDLRYRDHGTELHATYGLRLYQRETESDTGATPLLLHTGALSADVHATANLRVTGLASVVYGTTDYSYLPVVFPKGQATLAYAPEIFSATAALGFRENATERLELSLAFSGAHHEPVGGNIVLPTIGGTTPIGTPLSIPNFTGLSATPSASYKLTRTEKVTFSSLFEGEHITHIIFYDGANMPQPRSLDSFTVAPTVGLTTLYARRASLDVHAGVAINHLASSLATQPNTVTPVGGAIWEQRLVSLREWVLTSIVSDSVDFYVDPILALAAPRDTLAAGLTLLLPPTWSVGLEGTFSTSFKAHNLGDSQNYPDEVAASLNVPVRHRISEYLSMELGTRWSDRTPFYSAPNFGFHQRQLWLYVSLTGTTRATKRPTLE